MKKLAVDTISQLIYTPGYVSKYYKLQVRKGELIKKKFHLFPYPHVEKIFAKENLFGTCELFDELFTKSELEAYDSDYKVINEIVYLKAMVKIIFLDGSKTIYKYLYDCDAIDKYDEIKNKLNLKEIEDNISE